MRAFSPRRWRTANVDSGAAAGRRKLAVDEGATAAMLERAVHFAKRHAAWAISRGEVIRICNLQGRDIAHGVSRYNSDALRR